MARMKMITIRVDEAEHALFKGAAAAVDISISEYARDAMLARMALEALPVVVQSPAEVVEALERLDAKVGSPPPMIESPADVPAAVRRVASPEEARAFRPYSKEQQTGKAKGKKRADPPKSSPWPGVEPCRHGLLRCKVCGTG